MCFCRNLHVIVLSDLRFASPSVRTSASHHTQHTSIWNWAAKQHCWRTRLTHWAWRSEPQRDHLRWVGARWKNKLWRRFIHFAWISFFDRQVKGVSSSHSKAEGKRSSQGGGDAPAAKKVKTKVGWTVTAHPWPWSLSWRPASALQFTAHVWIYWVCCLELYRFV